MTIQSTFIHLGIIQILWQTSWGSISLNLISKHYSSVIHPSRKILFRDWKVSNNKRSLASHQSNFHASPGRKRKFPGPNRSNTSKVLIIPKAKQQIPGCLRELKTLKKNLSNLVFLIYPLTIWLNVFNYQTAINVTVILK